MTILPKKKQNKNNSEEDRDKEHQNERYNVNYGQISSSSQNGQISPNNRTWSVRSDDKRSAPESDGSGDHSNIGSTHLKRRHRNNRERDVPSDLQRSLINSVRTIGSKSSISSPSSSPRDLNNAENDLAIPGCSGMMNREESDIAHSNMLVPVGLAMRGAGGGVGGGGDGDDEDDDDKKDISGYNSGDEYHKPKEHWTNVDWEEKERIFDRKMRKKGFIIKKMCEDGACLFRAVADQVYGDQEMHTSVRKLCMDYMEKNCDYFSQYVTENFADYIERKRCDHSHGNHIEMQALSEIFNRPIQVYAYSMEPINIFQGCEQTDDEPIRISYHRNVHYNSIVNPFKATIGVGLGLPSFKPGLAEKTLMEKAKLISEQHELEQAMLEDKIRATDWEATNEQIEEAIARQSYLEWLAENEIRHRKKASATTTSTLTKYADEESASANGSSPKSYSPRASSKSPLNERVVRSPKRISNNSTNNETNESTGKKPICQSSQSIQVEEASNFLRQIPSSVLGLNDWDEDDDILAQVLAQSQAEYIESLKSGSASTNSSSATDTTTTGAIDSSATTSTTNSGDYFSLPSTSSNYRS